MTKGGVCGLVHLNVVRSEPSDIILAMPDSLDLLTVSHISKRFGITQALDDVSAAFRPGEVHALMGENGAGKSTLGKVIAGLHRQDSGTVVIAGRTLTPGSLDNAFAAGVRIVHQELAQCPNLTVAENLCLHDLPRNRLGLIDRRAMRERAARLVRVIEPLIDVEAPLGALSPGHRQIVQIAAALDDRSTLVDERTALLDAPDQTPADGESQPKSHRAARVIVFDEPTSSLSISEADRLLAIIRGLAASGITVIYVSHRMGEIFACCDRVSVLRDGKFVATSTIREIDEHTLIEQMIGRRLEAVLRQPKPIGLASEKPTPALEVRGISSPGKLRDVGLTIHPGEIVGIGGLVGAGRSELLDAIFGLDPRATGKVVVNNRPLPPHQPRAAMRAKVGYVPEDRKLQGLFFQLGVDENILVPVMPALARFGFRRRRVERALVTDRLRAFQVKTASPSAVPGSLSGGNQQKLLIARWMSRDVKVLLLDEPTRGIDVGTKAEVYRLIREAAAGGVAVLLVSSEMPELLALSDRILVLAGGRLRGELTGDAMTQASILRLATAESAVRTAF
jgi:ABC-type sugar transport system ATPase subunit